jgi:ABC-type uncharacterized transport system fused permease/ATPase subunit
VDIALDALRCPPADMAVTHLSGGERRRVALCRLLLEKPWFQVLDSVVNISRPLTKEKLSIQVRPHVLAVTAPVVRAY